MDNNFYDNRETRKRNTHEKQTDKNVMTKIIVIQLVLSLSVTGILFAVCRKDSTLSQNIKTFYGTICEKDISVSEIIGVFKKVAQTTFAPSVSEENTTVAGETNNDLSGEKADFSPVYLTVNFANPIENINISSNFGYRISPITHKYSLHTGLDIASPENSEIYAVYDGVVEKAEYNEVRGNYVIIKHSNSLKTTYNHCNKLLVKENEKVKKGEKIALVGATGYATGNHLHFEVILNGKYINPIWVLRDEISTI